jgi:hypothetical protein
MNKKEDKKNCKKNRKITKKQFILVGEFRKICSEKT